jgi:hypothetical protein
VPNISANLFSVAQLTHIGKIIEFWLNQFFVRDLKKGKYIVFNKILNMTDNLYKFCDTT